MDEKELQLILQQGEGQFIEFKENLDKSLASEIVAFANASGGKIFLGINDKGIITGVSITNKLKSQIQDIARNCDPEILINIDEIENILIINVNEGINKPYSCSTGFYMRINANSQKMKRDEILKLAIKGGKIRFDEQICSNFDWKDFDQEKFEYYLKLARISNNLDKKEILRNLNILTDEGFTNAGVLFFAKKPHKYIITSKVRCVHFNDNDRVNILDKKEVDKGIIGNIEFAIEYLKDRVPVEFIIETAKRKEIPEYPEKAYREAIINSIIHFDYFLGSGIAIEKLKSSIFINNKGELLFDKKYFGSRSELRNRLLADLLSRTEYMERVGTGVKRIKEACSSNGNKVEFDFSDSFFVKIYSINEPLNEPLNVVEFVKKNPGCKRNDIVKGTGLSLAKVKRILASSKSIKRKGSDKTGGYYIK